MSRFIQRECKTHCLAPVKSVYGRVCSIDINNMSLGSVVIESMHEYLYYFLRIIGIVVLGTIGTGSINTSN